jgi:hypothetical protein
MYNFINNQFYNYYIVMPLIPFNYFNYFYLSIPILEFIHLITDHQVLNKFLQN